MSLNSNTPDSKELEAMLRQLSPKALDSELLNRLDDAAEGSLEIQTPDELKFETTLRRFTPSPLPADFFASLEKTVSNTPFPVNEKILLFPKSAPETLKRSRSSRSIWSAAAAVAILGASAALLLPQSTRTAQRNHQVSSHTEETAPAPVDGPISKTSGNLVPAGFERGLNSARDEGIYWGPSNAPRRVVRVEYIDHYTLKDKDGKITKVDQPRVQYILVPEKVD